MSDIEVSGWYPVSFPIAQAVRVIAQNLDRIGQTDKIGRILVNPPLLTQNNGWVRFIGYWPEPSKVSRHTGGRKCANVSCSCHNEGIT